MSTQRQTVSLRALAWRASYNRHLLTAVIVALGGLSLWRTVDPPARVIERPVSSGGVDLAAAAYAQRFTAAYLSFDTDDLQARVAALATFDAQGAAAGSDGYVPPAAGRRTVTAVTLVSRLATPAGERYVIGADTRPDGRIYLAVTVTRDARGALRLVGFPAIVGGPLTGAPIDAPSGAPVEDAPLTAVLSRAVRNYLAGRAQDLAADLASDATVSLPAQPLRLVRLVELRAEPGPGGLVLVTVQAQSRAGEQLTLTYEMAVVQRAGRWLVRAIATNPTGR